MQFNVSGIKEIEVGDLVQYEKELYFVAYESDVEYCYLLIGLKDFKVKECWHSLHDLSLECKLVEKNHKLKLEVI